MNRRSIFQSIAAFIGGIGIAKATERQPAKVGTPVDARCGVPCDEVENGQQTYTQARAEAIEEWKRLMPLDRNREA